MHKNHIGITSLNLEGFAHGIVAYCFNIRDVYVLIILLKYILKISSIFYALDLISGIVYIYNMCTECYTYRSAISTNFLQSIYFFNVGIYRIH